MRVERAGAVANIEVEYLTPDERRTLLMGRDPEEVMRWMDMVCGSLVETEILLRQVAADAVFKASDEQPGEAR